MRDYSKVGPKFWIGKTGKKLRAAGATAQVVAMYLMTSPSANMLGLYYVSKNSIGYETGLGEEGASKGLASCVEAGFCEYDDDSEMVWVYEMARHQIADALVASDKRCLGVQNEYSQLPDNPFLARFFEQYADAFHLTKQRGVAPAKSAPRQAPSKPLASQEQEQAQEQEQEQEQEQAQAARAGTATELSIAMRKNGVQTQPADPRLIALAEQGVTPETVAAACEEAKRAKPNETIGFGYVAKILERWAADAAGMKASGAMAPHSRASPGSRPNRQEALEQRNREIARQVAGETA